MKAFRVNEMKNMIWFPFLLSCGGFCYFTRSLSKIWRILTSLHFRAALKKAELPVWCVHITGSMECLHVHIMISYRKFGENGASKGMYWHRKLELQGCHVNELWSECCVTNSFLMENADTSHRTVILLL